MKAINGIILLLTMSLQDIKGGGIQVQVKQGILSGERLKTVTGEDYYSFKGIPYAKPPVGELRFKAPQVPESWDGVREATNHGPICPQVNLFTNQYIPGSEDCLFLNVYTSNLTPIKPLPVIFYIFGGSFRFGSGNVDFYGPDFLVTKNVILVTINYRVDSLGFLSLGTCEVPGNAGLKDQVAALKWVQENIGNFGGNPSFVTIMGESAGAASVSYHLLSPMSKGLFSRAILMSGVLFSDWAYPYQPVRRAFALGKLLGLETKNTTELLNYLQTVEYDKLINTTAYVLASEEITDVLLKMQPFTPVIESEECKDSFISTDPLKALEYSTVNTADVMFGYNEKEGLVIIELYANNYIPKYNRFPELFVPSRILVNSKPDTILKIADKIVHYYFSEKTVNVDNLEEFLNYASNATFIYDIQNFFKKWPHVGNTYFYKFRGYSNRNFFGQQGAVYGLTGTAHFDDVFYLFDSKSLNIPFDINSTEHKMIEQITTIFTNFVKYGNPTPDSSLGVTWPQYEKDSLAYMDIAQNLTVKYAPDEDDYSFWKSCYEDAGLPF